MSSQLAERFKFRGDSLVNITGTNATFTQTTIQNHSVLIGGTFTM